MHGRVSQRATASALLPEDVQMMILPNSPNAHCTRVQTTPKCSGTWCMRCTTWRGRAHQHTHAAATGKRVDNSASNSTAHARVHMHMQLGTASVRAHTRTTLLCRWTTGRLRVVCCTATTITQHAYAPRRLTKLARCTHNALLLAAGPHTGCSTPQLLDTPKSSPATACTRTVKAHHQHTFQAFGATGAALTRQVGGGGC